MIAHIGHHLGITAFHTSPIGDARIAALLAQLRRDPQGVKARRIEIIAAQPPQENGHVLRSNANRSLSDKAATHA